MEAERWQQIDAIFDAVLDREPAERAAFLSSLCGSDGELRREVEELLKAHDESQDFIETVAVEVVAKNLAAAQVVHSVNRKIGSYEIDSLLGAGGMGEVYLAHDTKLNRRVALKLLPAHFAADAERLSRFKREAQAISALNHPNIVTIHDIGSTNEGEHFIATEFVEGRTLREIISSGKPSVLEILKIFIQICEALEAAHKAGIIHRDIKLENVMQRPDGLVKVLDFGLAKRLAAADDNHSQDFSATKKGFVIGTLNYLSPEQAVGDPLDPRTDLWSVGVCLFEVLTGKPPFGGASQQSVFNAILNSAAPIPTKVNGDLPPEFDLFVAKALEKDRELRYQTASDFRADLRRLNKLLDSSATWSSDTIKPIKQKRNRIWRATLAISLALALAGLVGFTVLQILKTDNSAPNWLKAMHRQLTDQPGIEFYPNLAPDGKSFVYSGNSSGNLDLFVQRVGGKKPINLTIDSLADETQPAFSPDGNRIAFRSERAPAGIYVIEATGENIRRICDFGYFPSWSPDGKEIVVSEDGLSLPTGRNLSQSALWLVNVETGAKRLLTKGDAVQPSWSPNNLRIAYWFASSGGRRDIATISVAGGEPAIITNDAATDWNPVWSPDGKYLYFASDRGGNMNFWRVEIDETTGQTRSEPEPVTMPSKYSRHLSFSRDGKQLIYCQTDKQRNIQSIEINAKTGKPIGEASWVTRGDREVFRPELSPDGSQFVLRLIRRTQEDIAIVSRDGTIWRDLTNDEFNDRTPRWSPDGKQIAFWSDRSGHYEIWMINSDGTNPRQVTYTKGEGASFPVWSPDGTKLLFSKGGKQSFIININRDWNAQEPQPLSKTESAADFTISDWSPDGSRLIGMISGGGHGIGLYSLATNRYEKILDFGEYPVWLEDSRQVVFTFENKAFILDTQTHKTREIPTPKAGGEIRNISVSRDNRLLYFTVHSNYSDIWLLSLD